MRTAYFETLEELFDDFLKMSVDVKKALEKSVQAFSENDRELARQVVKEDAYINEQESALSKQAVQIIALESPVVKDLRRVVTVMKSTNDLERMGDHARSVAISTLELNSNTNDEIKQIIEDMALEVDNMMTNIIEAMREQDCDRAVEYAKRDDIVDEMYDRVRRLVAKALTDPEAETDVYLNYVTIASDIERIGDYSTNMAEQIVYLKTGEFPELNSRYNKEKAN